jgi:hypothetical protein
VGSRMNRIRMDLHIHSFISDSKSVRMSAILQLRIFIAFG